MKVWNKKSHLIKISLSLSNFPKPGRAPLRRGNRTQSIITSSINCWLRPSAAANVIYFPHTQYSTFRTVLNQHGVVKSVSVSNTYESSSRRSLLVLSWLFRRSKSARTWASSSSSLELRLQGWHNNTHAWKVRLNKYTANLFTSQIKLG